MNYIFPILLAIILAVTVLSIEIMTPYGYGVVDKNNSPLQNVARPTPSVLQAMVKEWNESENAQDVLRPWKVVKLYYSNVEVK